MIFDEIIKRDKAMAQLSPENHYAAEHSQKTLRRYIEALEKCMKEIQTISQADDYCFFCSVIEKTLEGEK